MQVKKRRLSRLMRGSVQFIIPQFQRDYSWQEEHCQQFLNDVKRVGPAADSEHFFGSIVSVSTKDSTPDCARRLLIDGQQRVTTASLLVAALRDHVRENASTASDGTDRVAQEFLLNSCDKQQDRPKLQLRGHDDDAMRKVVGGKGETASAKGSPNVFQNYRFFRDCLREPDVDIAQIVAGIGKLTVVDVSLELGKDDPQQVFESLNSTGLDLTQADLVRNYILMGLDEADQTTLYRKYWIKVEKLYSGNPRQLDRFLRDFLALETNSQMQGEIDQVYPNFRNQFRDAKGDAKKLETCLRRILKFARYHAAFVLGSHDLGKLMDSLGRVRAVSTTPAILVMSLLRAHKKRPKTCAASVVQEALWLIESYLVRRDVCDLPTRAYWPRLAKVAYALDANDLLSSLRVNLYRLNESNYGFPTDDQFRHALVYEDLFRKWTCGTVLKGLENREGIRTRKDSQDLGKHTIEHIMPGSLRASWEEMLGADWKSAHETWLHRLGNLTLTLYNPELGNRPFREKKSLNPGGYIRSGLRLDNFLRRQKVWTTWEIESRGRLLAGKALKIWPQLKLSAKERQRAEAERLAELGGNIERTRSAIAREDVRDRLDQFRTLVLNQKTLDEPLEVAQPKSVSYYNSQNEFVCEVLPRTNRINVLFQIDPGEASQYGLPILDTKDYLYLFHAQNDWLCFVCLYTSKDVKACEPLLHKAIEEAKRQV